MAQGRFSQPRKPRQEDYEAQFRRPAVQPQPETLTSQPDISMEETMVLPESPLPGQQSVSFDEALFQQETAGEPQYREDTEEDYEAYIPPRPRKKSKRSQTRKILLVSLCVATLLLLIAIIAGVMLFVNSNADDGLILNNVTIAGVNVGGMTPEEAAEAIHRVTDLTYTVENMVVKLPDTILELSPEDTGAKLDINAAVEAAYNYGRTGTAEENKQAHANSLVSNHTIALLPYLSLDLDYIRQTLDAYGENFNSTFTQSSWELEGEMPQLEGDKFDETAPCQVLVLNPGSPGRYIDLDKVYNDILDAYSMNTFLVETEMTDEEVTPDPLDLEAIFAEICSDPVDAGMDMETFEVTLEVYGYTFDLESAQEKLRGTEYGDTIGIPMEYVVPNVLSSDLEGKLFSDELGYCETKHTNDANRNHNLKLACETINGYILMPGDTFDYNKVLGKRTEEAGYKPAGAINGGVSVTEVGGGICQVSSTLYYCALLSDMEIVTRRSHSLVSTYMPMGMDATVSWGGPDFRFKNNTNYPIRIQAEVSGGYVKIRLLGTDEKDYYIKMEYKIVAIEDPETIYEEYTPENVPSGYYDGMVKQQPVTGYTVYTYRCKYSKETNELISRTYEATSTYICKDKIVIKILEPATEPTDPVTEPTQPPTEGTTPPTEPPVTDPPTTPPTTAPAA